MDIGDLNMGESQNTINQEKRKGKAKESENGKQTSKVKKATWDPHSHKVFIDLCIDEVRAGNRPSTHFNKEGWNNIQKNFYLATGKNYDRLQLKNHWDSIKKEWLLWEALVGKETLLGWDHDKKTIQASDEWWNEKIQRNPDVAKFRVKPLEHCLKMDKLFMDIAATGGRAWAPNSGVMPSFFSQSETIELDVSQSDMPFEDKVSEIPSSNSIKANLNVKANDEGKIKRGVWNIKTEGQCKKVTTGSKLERQLECLVDAFEKRRKVARVTPTVTPTGLNKNEENSIQECMDLLDEIPEIERLNNLFMFATHLFLKSKNRAMFIALRDATSRVAWLKHEQEQTYATRRT